MRRLTFIMLIIALPVLAKAQANCAALFDQPLRRLHSTDTVDLCALTAGKAVLVVNTASHCGFTPQFEGLEALYKKYRKQGFEVIGFASDDFFQEDNDESEAANICYVNFGVTFTMLAPTHVRGKKANSVFKVLNQATRSPSWNFNKYLVSANGEQIQHFGSRTKPDDKKLSAAIENLLQEH